MVSDFIIGRIDEFLRKMEKRAYMGKQKKKSGEDLIPEKSGWDTSAAFIKTSVPMQIKDKDGNMVEVRVTYD